MHTGGTDELSQNTIHINMHHAPPPIQLIQQGSIIKGTYSMFFIFGVTECTCNWTGSINCFGGIHNIAAE